MAELKRFYRRMPDRTVFDLGEGSGILYLFIKKVRVEYRFLCSTAVNNVQAIRLLVEFLENLQRQDRSVKQLKELPVTSVTNYCRLQSQYDPNKSEPYRLYLTSIPKVEVGLRQNEMDEIINALKKRFKMD